MATSMMLTSAVQDALNADSEDEDVPAKMMYFDETNGEKTIDGADGHHSHFGHNYSHSHNQPTGGHHHANHKTFSDLLRSDRNTQRLTIFGVLLFLFFFLEIVFAIITGSVSLLSDAFHMLSDLSATCLAVYAIVVSHRPNTDAFTYGLSRAQVLGGLVNGIFLLSVTFMLSVEVAMKFVHADELKDIDGHGLDITYVGAAGLAVNIVGMVLLGEHGHSHAGGGGHSHSHGGGHGHAHDHDTDDPHDKKKKEKREASHGDLNMKAAWLHALGDTLGSVVVVVVGLVVHFGEGDWKFYADPALTAVILVIITYSAVPLVRSCSKILVQGAPEEIDIQAVKEAVSAICNDIVDIHDLHIWQLEPGNCCGSLHVLFGNEFDSLAFSSVAEQMKSVLHKFGIHSVAIQPEFSSHVCADTNVQGTVEYCYTEMTCLLPCEPGCEQAAVCCSDREVTRLHKRKKAPCLMHNTYI